MLLVTDIFQLFTEIGKNKTNGENTRAAWRRGNDACDVKWGANLQEERTDGRREGGREEGEDRAPQEGELEKAR
ncbi:hypothetical protein EYF80_015013 [Liparis tanakae]|uniref:Uncharacterized protein n=1 Tax=Liparis tanakae TaxID=230148 RepID=A0A4Z2IB78_9TELE|nr:hypothetical protein EYF80_015013 [Liparis tanakae]